MSPTPDADDPRSLFAADVRAGLTMVGQKQLFSRYLYDELGSALFEVICLLPEYGVSRAGERVLQEHLKDVVARLPAELAVAELGSGSGKKTKLLLEALSTSGPVNYFPIDISRAAIERTELELRHIDSVHVVGFEQAYLDGLGLAAARRRPEESLLVLFLGGTIGNFDRPAAVRFLADVRRHLRRGDFLLLATDLVKEAERLVLAYDDPTGVTAAFNLNLLGRVNRELEGDFDLRQFAHKARYDELERRIEMHLVARVDQRVRIRGAELQVEFRKGETIWTESSHKFTCPEVLEMGERAGFRCEEQWTDREWPFAQSLFVVRAD